MDDYTDKLGEFFEPAPEVPAPPPPPAPPAPPESDFTGTVRVIKGNSLHTIAQTITGDEERWTELAEANPDRNFNRASLLQRGELIVLPQSWVPHKKEEATPYPSMTTMTSTAPSSATSSSAPVQKP
jgi:hypothetical protein